MKKTDGFSLVEVLLAVSVFSLLVIIFIGTLLYGQESSVISGTRNRATLLAEEGLEAARNLRDDNYANLFNGTYGLAISGNLWTLSGSSDVTDIFTRSISIAQVNAHTKQITSQVTWQQNGQRTGNVTLVSYLTDWRLGSGATPTPLPGWNNPTFQASLDTAGTQDGLKVQVQGNYAYMVRIGGTPNFIIYDVSNPASPSQVGSLALSGAPNNIAVSGNFAYIASGDNLQELQVINVSNPASPSQVGSFDATGGADALGVWVSGNTAYISRAASTAEEIFTINVTTPSSPTVLGSLELGSGATGNEIIVLGTDVYVASNAATELFVINASNPASLTLTSAFDASGGSNALTIAGFNSTILLGRGDNTLSLVNVSNPAAPAVLGTINVNGNVNDISIGASNLYAFLAVNYGVGEFQVIDISNPAIPSLLGLANLAGSTQSRGVAYDAVHDRAMVATANSNAEFQIIRPSP